VCKGARYNRETLEVQYKGKNISQVLDMTAEEAVDFFENLPKIRRKVQTLVEVGLGYVKLGQSSTTLSGGEAQRVKLATELARIATGKTIYVLDEPTTGLHAADVHKLIHVLQALVDAGYAHGLMAGNALATHDLEGALLHTALGQDIYTQRLVPNGHYNHQDILNKVRRCGSIPNFVKEYKLDDGIMCSCVKTGVPFVLAGSIRDDGPLPEVYEHTYVGQDTIRSHVRKATTVIGMATVLHTIAAGNMTPTYRVLEDGTIRPIHFYIVDTSEFAANKLGDRGSLSAKGIVTNVQDFMNNICNGLGLL
jgi:hypothetical protein